MMVQYLYVASSAAVKQNRGKWELQLPLAHLYPSSFVRPVCDPAVEQKSKMQQMSKVNRVCGIAATHTSFKSGVHFGFPASSETMCRHCRIITDAHLHGAFLHIL